MNSTFPPQKFRYPDGLQNTVARVVLYYNDVNEEGAFDVQAEYEDIPGYLEQQYGQFSRQDTANVASKSIFVTNNESLFEDIVQPTHGYIEIVSNLGQYVGVFNFDMVSILRNLDGTVHHITLHLAENRRKFSS